MQYCSRAVGNSRLLRPSQSKYFDPPLPLGEGVDNTIELSWANAVVRQHSSLFVVWRLLSR